MPDYYKALPPKVEAQQYRSTNPGKQAIRDFVPKELIVERDNKMFVVFDLAPDGKSIERELVEYDFVVAYPSPFGDRPLFMVLSQKEFDNRYERW